jgi:DNA processing protein
MENNEKRFILALHRAVGIGDINAKKLISHCGSAEAVFREKKSALKKIHGIGKTILKELNNSKLFEAAENELLFIEKNGIVLHTVFDPDYPEKLKHCADGPLLVFQKGEINLRAQKILSIVGTRMMTNYGKSFLESFISDIKSHHPVIVSGLAFGVDIFAHQTAMQQGLQTVGVLAHGLDGVYPKVHRHFAEQMQENGGIISDFWSGSRPDRENFVKRNRIVAGISEATIVIESASKGGSLITADIANSYNRDVFAVPGRTTDLFSTGCNNLIKQNKAVLLTGVKDLEYMLNWKVEKEVKNKAIQKQLFVDLDDQEKVICDCLQNKGKQLLDNLALHCSFPIHKTAGLLLQLELKGLVRPLPGKLFEII